MKDVAVYVGYTEMLKGAGYRLAHLRGEIATRIIWEAVILTFNPDHRRCGFGYS